MISPTLVDFHTQHFKLFNLTQNPDDSQLNQLFQPKSGPGPRCTEPIKSGLVTWHSGETAAAVFFGQNIELSKDLLSNKNGNMAGWNIHHE